MDKRKELALIAKELRDTNKETMTKEELEKWNKRKIDYDNLKAEIEKEEKEEKEKANRKNFLSDEDKYLNERIDDPKKPIFSEAKTKYKRKFRNLGEQLQAVRKASTPGSGIDERLKAVNKEVETRASGMNEGIGSEGAFALEPDFAGRIFETSVEIGEIMSRVDKKPVSGSGIKWMDVDESSVATSVYGGVIAYWAAEAGTVTATKPKLSKRSMDLEKLMGICYATDELDEDAAFMSAWYEESFSTAVNRSVEIAIINGTGAGVPLGILNAPNLVSVAKEAGQAADTIVYENLNNMYYRMPAAKRREAVWLVHPDALPQLGKMSLTVGAGGIPVFLPASGIAEKGYQTLFGKPIVDTDCMAALGDQGDVVFANLKDYMMIQKAGANGGMKWDVSMHVQFLYGENTYRIIFRCNGMPKKSSALTIRNSSNTRSSFVTLDERA